MYCPTLWRESLYAAREKSRSARGVRRRSKSLPIGPISTAGRIIRSPTSAVPSIPTHSPTEIGDRGKGAEGEDKQTESADERGLDHCRTTAMISRQNCHAAILAGSRCGNPGRSARSNRIMNPVLASTDLAAGRVADEATMHWSVAYNQKSIADNTFKKHRHPWHPNPKLIFCPMARDSFI